MDMIELASCKRREKETAKQLDSPQESRPTPLPRPGYATLPGVIGRGETEVYFYTIRAQGLGNFLHLWE